MTGTARPGGAGACARSRSWSPSWPVQVGVTSRRDARPGARSRSTPAIAPARSSASPRLPAARCWSPVAALASPFVATLAYWALDYARPARCSRPDRHAGHAVLAGHRRVGVASAGRRLHRLPLARRRPRQRGGRRRSACCSRSPPGWSRCSAWWSSCAAAATAPARRPGRRPRRCSRQAADERLRIARELHDAVAHNISLINIQAGVALHLDRRPPEQARDALAAIKEASKDALVELRSILGVLRQVDEDGAPRAPTPSLDRLDELVGRAPRPPVSTCSSTSTADLGRLPRERRPGRVPHRPGVADQRRPPRRPPRRGRADRRPSSDALVVEVARRRLAAAGAGELPSGGNGIAGMRERAAAVGGTLEAGPRPGRRLRGAGRGCPIGERRDDPRAARRRPGARAQRPARRCSTPSPTSRWSARRATATTRVAARRASCGPTSC